MSWDGKMYNKYRIEHTDGTPLKGKKYFVLRLDSDDPLEAARVAAAMRAYKSEPRNCDKVKTSWDVLKEWHEGLDTANDVVRMLDWLLAPATEQEGGANG